MNEWLKKTMEKLKNFWKSASVVKKVILLGVIAAVIILIAVTIGTSSSKSLERIFNHPITNQSDLMKIESRLDAENVYYNVDADGYISVLDSKTAVHWRSVLVTEGLVSTDVDPFEGLFDRGWSTTDADQNIKHKNAIQAQLTQHIQAIEDISKASVILALPENNLFADYQEPVKASVSLTLRRNSDLATNKTRLKGLQSLILSAVEGLTADNLIITDNLGVRLNDFEGMAELDRVNRTKKEQELKRQWEEALSRDVLKSLQTVVSKKRIENVLTSIEVNWSKINRDQNILSPVIITEQDSEKPYDTTEKRDHLVESVETITKTWEGQGVNPEGPTGIEGQNPPTYNDPTNVVGKSTETAVKENHLVNQEHRTEEVAPTPGRRTISAYIDGIWSFELDEDKNEIWEGKSRRRKCVPVSNDVIKQWEEAVFVGTGCNKKRGDSVKLVAAEFDHSEQFREEDEAELKARQTRQTILWVLIAVAVVLVGFILFRVISKELEKRRRLREEEELRKQQAAREQQLWDAKDEANMQVTMSVEESRRAELLENAVNLAKEHPEDVALLIRTWLMEE